MTFKEVLEEYDHQEKTSREMGAEWLNKGCLKHSPTPNCGLDYNKLAVMIVRAIQDEYGFNRKQSQFIYGIAYEDHHSLFSDVIWQSQYFAERMQRWEKLR